MSEKTWDRVKSIFHEASALPADDRSSFLDQVCADDENLRIEVEGLLESHQELGDDDSEAMTEGVGAATEGAGDLIGRYKLLQTIGEGGFGMVYMAEQEEPVRRRVALKIIKLGMDTKEVIARFEAERQALALMDHPNIAKVLDAGATETGRPYFVMELVRGVPITEYCDQNKLGTTRAARAVHARSAARSSTPTRRASSTGTSSRPTSWSRSTTASRCRRSSTSASPRRPISG